MSLVVAATGGSGTVVIGGGGDPSAPKLTLNPSPSFVIAEKGVRHDFRPLFTNGISLVGPGGVVSPPYVYRVTLTEGPGGMTVSEGAVLEWIPGAERIDETVPCTLLFSVSIDGAEIFTSTRTIFLNVLVGLPTMQPHGHTVSYERDSWDAASVTIFEGYQPNDEDKELFRWSLINPPPGASISLEGYVKWPDDRGYARDEPYEFKIRLEYDTPTGTVFDESFQSHRVLPEAATDDYDELRPSIRTEEGGMLGFSLGEGDGWLAAGEPSPRFGFALPGADSGKVRLWRFDPTLKTYRESFIIQPGITLGSESFGAAVSISEARNGLPTRLAVGAPDSDRLRPDGTRRLFVGSVYVYSQDPGGNWQSEGRLDPPFEEEYLYFGGWISISGSTLIASMEGESSQGTSTGALAVFQHDGTRWVLSETLTAPVPTGGDFFSYPCATDGEWIAAAANENDDDGQNAGAVHLFQKEGDRFIHRQRIGSPLPQADALFGERLLLDGPWLFVSAFRENNATGAVHVFKRNGTQWDFQQSLASPFAGAGSGFGLGLAISDDVLSVSAPGDLFLAGGYTPNDGNHPWKGITLFNLRNGVWKWSRQATDSPGGGAWGFALAQPSPDVTVTSMPDYPGYSGNQSVLFAGRSFLHRWPARIQDPFSAILAALPLENGQPATANGDTNGNGVPNLLEWMMGYDLLTGARPSGLVTSQGPQPLLRRTGGKLHLMVPELKRGLGYKVSIESSEDLEEWRDESEAAWETFENTGLLPGIGLQFPIPIHPVRLKMDGPSRFYRLTAVSGSQ